MEKFLRYRILLGILAFSLGQQALAFTYKIELLVFTHTLPTTEQFDLTASPIQWPNDMLEIVAPAIASPASVIQMPLDGLNQVSTRLAQTKNYTVLFQTAWLQTINNNQAGQPVHFNNPNNTLNGFIKVSADPGLKIQVEAEYSPIKTQTHKTKSEPHSALYRLTENRMLKASEIHYFDHPTFGIITLITPIS